jgi:hypothetical protein
MYKILSASKDTYITNKIIRNSFRATDANVGRAGTLDLFKMFGESASGSVSEPIEISRLLVKFDLSPLEEMHSKQQVDMNNSSFKVMLNLKDVYGGQTTPNNFKAIVFPLAKNFDEGIGRDIVNFGDLDATNFLTSSVSSGVITKWNLPGAKASGSLGAANIDVIVSGSLDGQTINLSREQSFITGEEDLLVDVTKIISGTIDNKISDHGFLIAFSGSFENDQKTYFVKRFGSRHAQDYTKRPKLEVKFDDTIADNHENFIFSSTGSIFLNNINNGVLTNIVSGTAATQISGENCMLLTLKSGSFSKIITCSQHKIGGLFQTGIYSASFAISEYATRIMYEEVISAGSASFDEIWGSLDGSIGYHTSSLVINSPFRSSFDGSESRLITTIKNLKSRYRENSITKLRVFIENRDRDIKFTKGPVETKSQIFSNMYYRVVDKQSGKVVIPFDTSHNSTKLSTDSDGMFFKFHMSNLEPGRLYKFEFLIEDFNQAKIIDDASADFTILPGKSHTFDF